jgi:MoaA/NifB/PqqE/SkfB family radical SAM enzyme
MTLQDVSFMLRETHSGRADFSVEILAAIRAFSHIILHGAGLYGQEILEFLVLEGVERNKISYWDYSYDEPVKIEGVWVYPQFAGNFPPTSALVIHCIREVSMEDVTIPEGYLRLDSHLLYECFMCPLTLGEGRASSLCVKSHRCHAAHCPRLENKTFNEDDKALNIFTFTISRKCTLSCGHCLQYINHFPKEERISFSEKQIKSDIDRIAEVFGFIRTVLVCGGEAFLHPALPAIVRHALSKPDFGVIKVLTNGVCDIPDETIDVLKHERCQLQFRDYTDQLTEKQTRLFRKNIAKAKNADIAYHVLKGTWVYPASLHKQDYSDEQMQQMKANCNSHKNCRTVIDGMYYPCSLAMSIHQHHFSNYTKDRIILDECSAIEEMRRKIDECDGRPFYESCRHCVLGRKSIPSGEQGKNIRYLHIERG